eukprot:Tbor_TRINITY_DN8560_c0_g1::TRINITY_DN8560_c0_g1_i1::g.18090::m.18090/K13348/MPV17; protein Mpv17
MVRAFFAWYNLKLKTHALITNMCTSATIAGCGDLSAQTILRNYTIGDPAACPRITTQAERDHPLVFERETTGKVDLRRTMIIMMFSFLVGTPMWSFMYGRLDKVFPKRSIAVALKKGVCTWGFGFITSTLLIVYIKAMTSLILENQTTTKAIQIIKAEVGAKMMSDMPLLQGYGLMYWSLHWIPLFYLLPHHIRLVYASLCQVGWSTIASWIVNEKRNQKKIQQVEK